MFRASQCTFSQRRAWLSALAIGFSLVLIIAFKATAHSGATGIVKERMEAMKSMADATKAIGKMIKGEARFDAEAMAGHAQTIHDHSQDVLRYFPEDSLQKASEALPSIWQSWDKFERITKQLQQASTQLADIARSGDQKAARKQFASMAKSCKACHQDFRMKKH